MEKKVRISEKWLNKLKEFEGLRLTAYVCAGGKKTIGYGHIIKPNEKERISESEAHAYLLQDLIETERHIAKLEKEIGTLSQGQWDALVSFAFNVGIRWISSSTIKECLKKDKNSADIGVCLKRWCYASGNKLQGLYNRRLAEAERYYETE